MLRAVEGVLSTGHMLTGHVPRAHIVRGRLASGHSHITQISVTFSPPPSWYGLVVHSFVYRTYIGGLMLNGHMLIEYMLRADIVG